MSSIEYLLGIFNAPNNMRETPLLADPPPHGPTSERGGPGGDSAWCKSALRPAGGKDEGLRGPPLAARAGFRGGEHGFPYEAPPEVIAARLQACGLEQVLCNFPPGDRRRGERGVAALPGREEVFAGCVERAIVYSRALSCSCLHAMTGTLPAGVSRQDCEAVYVRNLRWAADMLKPYGIRLLIEPLNTQDNPGYFLTTTAQACQIIERVGCDNLFLQMDLYHCQVMRGDLAEQLKTHLALIGHIQIAGTPGRHEPDVGEINHPYLFDLLDALGYTGWVDCEYHPRGDIMAGLGWGRAYGLGVV